MLLDFFETALKIFIKHRKDEISAESDMLQIRKRQLLHKGIPELKEIKRVVGEDCFNKLFQLFNSLDPIKSQALSENPDKYLYLTKTLIYKLPKQTTREAIADLLYVEFSLWFKHEYNFFEDKNSLIDAVYSFKTSYFPSDPFLRTI